MRQSANPWIAASFCAALSLITVVGDLVVSIATRSGAPGGIDVVFYCFLPMCFYFVGAHLAELQRRNQELQARIDELAAALRAERPAA